MHYNWPSQEEKLLKYIKISPLKKLEWLREMNEWYLKLPKKYRQIRHNLKNA